MRSVITGCLALAIAGPVAAQTRTDQLQVRATVVANCVVDANDLDFGNYTGALAAASTTVVVQCTSGTAVAVAISGGSTNSPASRQMTTGGGGTLAYILYRDAGRTQAISTTDPAWTLTSAANTGAIQTWNLYGAVPGGQFAAPGTYVDTLTVTVSY